MTRPYRQLGILSFGVVLAVMSACASDYDCGEGRYRKGRGCYLLDGGQDPHGGDGSALEASISEATVPATDGAAQPPATSDGSVGTSSDAQLADSNVADTSTPLDANADSSSGDSSAPNTADGSVDAAPPPECDATHACAPGLACANAKCVSACMQTQCDPNATCSLVGTEPTCNCNRGYTVISGSGRSVVCTRNLACDQLGCDAKAACEGTQEAGFQCRCISGYTGNGKSCTPVTCEAPPTVANFTWPTAAVTYGEATEGKCNAGYELSTGSASLLCGADKKWVGTPPACKPKDCGTPGVPKLADGTIVGAVQLIGGTTFTARADYTCTAPFTAPVGAVMTRTCQAGGTWSGSVPKCIGCGDREVQTGEDCEPKVAPWNAWTCSPSCQATTAYTVAACSKSSDCIQGQLCFYSQFCAPSCIGGTSCMPTPEGTNTSPYCVANTYCVAAGCKGNADCPSGLECRSANGSPLACLPP